MVLQGVYACKMMARASLGWALDFGFTGQVAECCSEDPAPFPCVKLQIARGA